MLEIERSDICLTSDEWQGLIDRWIQTVQPGKRVLLIPPDLTRRFSGGGEIAAYLYQALSPSHTVSVMPAVGTHRQMTAAEKAFFFPGIPAEAFLEHHWQTDTVSLGTVPADVSARATEGRYSEAIDVLLNRRLAAGEYDAVLSIGQVVPHEVAGFANYSKNLLVGLGGRDMINKSHMVGAIYGIERTLGNIDTPTRAIFDYAQRQYLDKLPVTFFLTVATEQANQASIFGLFIGRHRNAFEHACLLAQKKNVTYLPKRVQRVVAYLDPAEFTTTWVGCKAVYRTRMIIEDGGTLIVVAPGVRRFGENDEVDQCIRRYGYCGTERIMALYRQHAFDHLEMAAAHLIHGSSEGRFTIVYATDPALLSQAEVESVGFQWMPVRKALEQYAPTEKETGFYTLRGEPYYYVRSPAVGLWRTR